MDKQKVRRAPRLLGRAASIAVRLWNEEHLHRLLVGTRRFVLCALLMQANVFDGYAPFGLAMASAMMAHGAGLSAVGGVVCGAMLIDDGLLGGVYVAATLIVLCVMSVCTGLRVVQRPWFAPAVAAAAGAACTFIFLPAGDELRAPAVMTFLAVQGLTCGGRRRLRRGNGSRRGLRSAVHLLLRPLRARGRAVPRRRTRKVRRLRVHLWSVCLHARHGERPVHSAPVRADSGSAAVRVAARGGLECAAAHAAARNARR